LLRPENENISYPLFYLLWHQPVAILALDRSNSKARSFLRKLGSCHELFRSCLRRLVALRSSSPSAPGNMSMTLKDLHFVSRFYGVFHYCLVPPPSDPEIEVLVSLANHSLEEARPAIVAAIQFHNDPNASCVTTEEYDRMIDNTQAESWTCIKHFSVDDRWRILEEGFLSKRQATDINQDRKTARQNAKKSMESFAESLYGNDEVCTNCFRLESGLEEGEKLMICPLCEQVNYCSRECQKDHWKKFHKKECIGNDKMCNNCFRLESELEEGKELMICALCEQVKYCSRECQTEHWKKKHKKKCIGGKGKSKKK
jgi:hypothetical protein